MGNFLTDLQGGIKQVTDVVETVGDFGEAVGDVFGTSGLNKLEKNEATRLQAKISSGQPLEPWETKNVDYLTQKGASFSYPMEYMSGGGSTTGIHTTGILEEVIGGATDAAVGAATDAAASGLTSLIPWWKGPGGKLQLPTSDPNIAQYLKQFSLDDSYLRVYYRAPRGYVVVRDAQGRPYAVLRQIAKQFGIWRPAAKPPISATDWKHYKRNRQIEKKLIKIARPALRAHSRPPSTKHKRR